MSLLNQWFFIGPTLKQVLKELSQNINPRQYFLYRLHFYKQYNWVQPRPEIKQKRIFSVSILSNFMFRAASRNTDQVIICCRTNINYGESRAGLLLGILCWRGRSGINTYSYSVMDRLEHRNSRHNTQYVPQTGLCLGGKSRVCGLLTLSLWAAS